MKRTFLMYLSGLILLISPLPAFADDRDQEIEDLKKRVQMLEEKDVDIAPESAPNSKHKMMEAIWKDGVRLVYETDGIKIQLGGRVHVDMLWWNGKNETKNAYGEFDTYGNGPHLNDGAEIRRARLYLKGELYEYVIFKAEFDLATGDVELADVYVGVQHIPVVGTVFVGHFKEPISLEELASNNDITFMERASINNLVPGRNLGVMFRNDIARRFTYALGVFRETDDQGFGIGEQNYNLSARITGLPVYMDDGRILLHLGASYSYRNPTDDLVHFNAKPEAHIAPNFLNTRDPITGTDLQSDGVQLIGGEAAFVMGPFSLQAEYMAALVQGLPFIFTPPFPVFPWSGGGNSLFQGGYVYASYILTGESRTYDTEEGSFKGVKPKKPFRPNKGNWGAFEVAARYSRLDLEDGVFNPNLAIGTGNFGQNTAGFGQMSNYTVAMNWYLNPNARVMFNYIVSDPDPNGLAHLFNTRFQVNF